LNKPTVTISGRGDVRVGSRVSEPSLLDSRLSMTPLETNLKLIVSRPRVIRHSSKYIYPPGHPTEYGFIITGKARSEREYIQMGPTGFQKTGMGPTGFQKTAMVPTGT